MIKVTAYWLAIFTLEFFTLIELNVLLLRLKSDTAEDILLSVIPVLVVKPAIPLKYSTLVPLPPA